jgi:hypothetical protein
MHTPADHPGTRPSAGDQHPAQSDAAGGTFRLRLRFSGLCLFVPEPADDARNGLRAIHVLLMNYGEDTPTHGWSGPTSGHHGAKSADDDPDPDVAHPKHYSMLYVDEGYFDPRARLTGSPVGIPLRDTLLRLPEKGAGIVHEEPLDAHVLPLHEISAVEALPRAWIEPRPGRQVAARVMLTAGQPMAHTSGALWRIEHPDGPPEDPMPIADQVEWEIPAVPGSELKLTLRHIDGDPDSPHAIRTLTLYPKAGDAGSGDAGAGGKNLELRLYLCCLPLYELPGGPRRQPLTHNAPAEHFAGFFELFPDVPRPSLRFQGTLRPLDRTRAPLTSETSTCTVAQVRLAARGSAES